MIHDSSPCLTTCIIFQIFLAYTLSRRNPTKNRYILTISQKKKKKKKRKMCSNNINQEMGLVPGPARWMEVQLPRYESHGFGTHGDIHGLLGSTRPVSSASPGASVSGFFSPASNKTFNVLFLPRVLRALLHYTPRLLTGYNAYLCPKQSKRGEIIEILFIPKPLDTSNRGTL